MQELKSDNNNEILVKAVKKLQLRFPVAEIHRATGVGKGDISNFLASKRPVSDKFLILFSEKFNIDLKEFGFTHGLVREEKKETTQDNNEWSALKQFNEHLKRENEFLRELLLKKQSGS